jgi:selenocysteine lyase/cysteine desulfurase
MESVQAGGAAFLTQAMVRGRFALRANVLHYATTREDIEALVEVVRETGAGIAAQV